MRTYECCCCTADCIGTRYRTVSYPFSANGTGDTESAETTVLATGSGETAVTVR